MTVKAFFFTVVFFSCASVFAQRDTIALHEVLISDSQLRTFSTSQSTTKLNDSVIRHNLPSLTQLLNYNSSIFFRENGFGMVSSASFRGTTAQQTAVVWNGININSQFNGQTDFNTIQANVFNEINIRAGGGSVIYGTSAIGGSIHLGNNLKFGNHFENRIQTEFGSFNTLAINYNVDAGGKNWTVNAAISHNKSDNNFKLFNGGRNINGRFTNLSFSANAAYRLNRGNILKFYNSVFEGDRHFSLLTPTDTKTKYFDSNSRNLLQWENTLGKLKSKIGAAYLKESYEYFQNIHNEISAGSKSNTLITKYDGVYIFKNIVLNGIVEYSKTKAQGVDLVQNSREITSTAILLKDQVSDKFNFELGIRKEFTEAYESPFLYSVGAKYKLKKYALRVNGSRNFRIPTFNDLFWIDGGNPNLKPESSFQGEIGNDFTFKNVTFSITGYYMKIADMIQWIPGTSSTWFPQNVNRVNSYGIESNFEYKKAFGSVQISLNGNYAYTVSENEATRKQLIYVPFHKATSALGIAVQRFNFTYQLLLNGETFTMSDNNPNYKIDAYSVSNIGLEYAITKNQNFVVGGKIRNVFDSEYEVIQNRTFPGRNYAIYLTLNI